MLRPTASLLLVVGVISAGCSTPDGRASGHAQAAVGAAAPGVAVPLGTESPATGPAGATRRPARLSNIERQTTWLPDVDLVQVYQLGEAPPLADPFGAGADDRGVPAGDRPQTRPPATAPTALFPLRPDESAYARILRYRTLRRAEAADFADLWRNVEFDRGSQLFCHFPVYAFRCFSDGKLIFETSVCWHCDNFYVRHAGGYEWHGFHGGAPGAKALLARFEALLGREGAAVPKEARSPDGGVLAGEPPADPPDPLELLEAKRSQAGDEDLACLKGMTATRDLNLAATHVTDAGLASIEGLTELRTLDLSYTAITDAGLAHLRPLRKLRRLNLWGVPVTDRGLAFLAGLTDLEELYLGSSASERDVRKAPGVTDAGLAHLAGLTSLRYLCLGGTGVAGPGLASLKGMHRLKQLSLDNTDVADAGLEALANLPSLNSLSLDKTRLTDGGLAHASGCRGLVFLFIADTAVTDEGLARLAGMPKLSNISLAGTRITNGAVPRLKDIPHLHCIWRGRTSLSDRGVEQLKAAFPDLTVQN